MADYHAVLSRTLSGFPNPKPELRTKLYERARMTIRRQLEARNPPPDEVTLRTELDKLEEAIATVEREYGGDSVAETAPSEPQPQPEVPPAPMPTVEPAPEATQTAATPPQVPDTASADAAELPAFDPAADPTDHARPVAEAGSMEPVYHEPSTQVAAEPQGPAPETTTPPVVDDLPEFVPVQPVSEPVVENVQAESVPAHDPVEGWADEFYNQIQDGDAPHDPAAEPAQQQAAPQPVDLDIAGFDPRSSNNLSIPPAPGLDAVDDASSGGRSYIGLLFTVLIVGLLALAAFFGWQNRDAVMGMVGLGTSGDDLTKPKPVKTITITPEEPEEPPVQEVPQSSEAAPKNEDRLTSEGELITPQEPAVVLPPEPATPEEPEAPADQEAETPSDGDQPVTDNAAPAVSQNAILYEEGTANGQNSVDAGRVVWTVVQEATGNGDETEPAIRGRVDVPERNFVLIMTIKRNRDQALPASHLIELIFAVPDDFPGGSIDAINRYVLKESEQSRGEALVGVPARIADGIFIIALNNLDEAKQKNESLLQTRNWIDIPMQYRTGRRALMTIEKGAPGEKVFNEVFEAWGEN
ncbi:MAG: hypothetical protein AAGF28_09795 [Pseudomonadota bacterium]